MKILIIKQTEQEAFDKPHIGCALTFELYKAYRCSSTRSCHLHITANHMWSKYTFIDEKNEYVGTFSTMDKLLAADYLKGFIGNCLVVTAEQWLDKQNPNWRTVERYQYW